MKLHYGLVALPVIMPGAGQPQLVWFAKACAIAFWA